VREVEEEKSARPDDEFKLYKGVERSTKVIVEAIQRDGPFDGVLTFS